MRSAWAVGQPLCAVVGACGVIAALGRDKTGKCCVFRRAESLGFSVLPRALPASINWNEVGRRAYPPSSCFQAKVKFSSHSDDKTAPSSTAAHATCTDRPARDLRAVTYSLG